MTTSQEKKESFLPPAESLEKYEKISKGLSKELVSLLKKEQEHRHRMQKMYLRNFRLGQLFGVLFLIYVTFTVFDLAIKGYVGVACTMSIVFGILILLILFQCRKDKIDAAAKTQYKNNSFKRNRNYNNNKKQINKSEIK